LSDKNEFNLSQMVLEVKEEEEENRNLKFEKNKKDSKRKREFWVENRGK